MSSSRSGKSMRMASEFASADGWFGMQVNIFPFTLSAGVPYAVPSSTPYNEEVSLFTLSNAPAASELPDAPDLPDLAVRCRLDAVKLRIRTFLRHEFFVRAHLHEAGAVEDDDEISHAHR